MDRHPSTPQEARASRARASPSRRASVRWRPSFQFATEEQAPALADATESGLAAYFYTRDLGRTWRLGHGLADYLEVTSLCVDGLGAPSAA